MVLVVPFDEFPSAAKRLGAHDVYLSERGHKTVFTATDPERQVILTTHTDLGPGEAKTQLVAQGLEVFHGQWADADPMLDGGVDDTQAFVVAVAYQSREHMPGLWMDAYPTAPTPQIVLRGMYDEFRANGELGDVTYEDFLKLAKPNVVILGPGEISTYLSQKVECP